jgi:hypothetical protein
MFCCMMCRMGSFVLYQTCYFLFSSTMCNLVLQITSLLIDHSVSKCSVRDQLKRLTLQIFLTVCLHGMCSRGSRLFATLQCEWKNVIQWTGIIFASVSKWNFMACGRGSTRCGSDHTIWMSCPDCVLCTECKYKIFGMISAEYTDLSQCDVCNDQAPLDTALWRHLLRAASTLWPRSYGCVECVAVLHRVGRLADWVAQWYDGLPDTRTLTFIVSSRC